DNTSGTLNMYLFTITLLTIHSVCSHENYKKCCNFGEVLAEIDSTYGCVEDTTRRREILSENENFLGGNSSGECAEVFSTDFFIFSVDGGKIGEKRPVSERRFPKCCPLNYTYNSIHHSCEKSVASSSDFINENFINVGLPDCKVIVDYELNGTGDFEYDLVNETNSFGGNQNDSGSYCIDETETGSFVKRKCEDSLEICRDKKCVKKCCPDGQSFINRAKCYDTYVHGLNLSSFSSIENPEVWWLLKSPAIEAGWLTSGGWFAGQEAAGAPFAIIHNRTCPKIYMMKEENYIFHLDDRGVLKYWQNLTETYIYEDVSHSTSYCIEHTKKKNMEGYFFFMCFPEKHINEKFQYTLWPKILSCIGLALTIAIYLILNETKKMFGKILVNYCVALLFQNSVLTYGQVYLTPTYVDCMLRAFSIIYFATAAFTWSNVMCCDIWWTFGSAKRTLGAHQRRRDLKKLLTYFLYGWGLPMVLTLIIYLFHSNSVLPYALHPFIGVGKCFFERRSRNYARSVFFNLPLLIMQLVNMVLFVKTIVYCLRVKNEINKINDTSKDDKSKKFERDKESGFRIFDMSQMGVVPKYIEIVWDFINCLQGVFIFIIFICKRTVLQNFLVKFKVLNAKNLSSASINTQSTTTSNSMSMKMHQPSNENVKMAVA
ncbi:hypothetical protein NQ318_019723, partial [Aromia moschata]